MARNRTTRRTNDTQGQPTAFQSEFSSNAGTEPRKPSNDSAPATPKINLRKLQLTEYTENGNLAFNKKEDEVWLLTEAQQSFRREFKTHDALILRGPAGSGKTDITVREVLGMLKDGAAKRVLITAPIDEGGEEIGFRKGTTFEKMLEHVNQILEAMDGHLGQGDFQAGKKIREALIAQGTIDMQPLGTLSGKNLRDTVLIVDEAHKAKMQHLLIAMTRLHTSGSKVIFIGDERQHLSKGVSAFRDFTKRFTAPEYSNHVSVVNYTADDIRRHPLIKMMSERGDDVPPGLAARMKEEEYTPAQVQQLLTQAFSNTGARNFLAEKIAGTILSRMERHEQLDLLKGSLGLKEDEISEPSYPQDTPEIGGPA